MTIVELEKDELEISLCNCSRKDILSKININLFTSENIYFIKEKI